MQQTGCKWLEGNHSGIPLEDLFFWEGWASTAEYKDLYKALESGMIWKQLFDSINAVSMGKVLQYWETTAIFSFWYLQMEATGISR